MAFETAQGTAALCVCAVPEVRPASVSYLQILDNPLGMAAALHPHSSPSPASVPGRALIGDCSKPSDSAVQKTPFAFFVFTREFIGHGF